jgi:hypothetical protein
MMPDQSIRRELSFGEVISKTFAAYRQDFARYFAVFVVVEAIIGVVTALARNYFVLPTLASNPTTQQIINWIPGFISALALLVGSIFIVTVVFFPIAQGSAIRLASDRIDKGTTDLGAAVRFATSKLFWIWGLSLLSRDHSSAGIHSPDSSRSNTRHNVLACLSRPPDREQGHCRQHEHEPQTRQQQMAEDARNIHRPRNHSSDSFIDRQRIERALRRREPSCQRFALSLLSTPLPDTIDSLLLFQPRQNPPGPSRSDTIVSRVRRKGRLTKRFKGLYENDRPRHDSLEPFVFLWFDCHLRAVSAT